MDYNQINKRLKDLHTVSSSLDEATGVSFVDVLRKAIVGTNKLDKINSIVVLAKLMDFMPQSDHINSRFDAKLFTSLFEVASSENVASESLRSILRISLKFLSGLIPATRTTEAFMPLILQAYDNYALLNNLTASLFDLDPRIVSATTDFVSKLLLRVYELQEDKLIIRLAQNLLNCQFFSKFCITADSNKFELDRSGTLRSLNKSAKLTNNYLAKLNFNPNVDIHQKLLNETLEILNKSSQETLKTTSGKFSIFNLSSSNPTKSLVEKYTVLDSIQLNCFLKSTNMTFKKQHIEHSMFTDDRSHFPIGSFSIFLSELFSSIDTDELKNFKKICYYFNSELYYAFMSKALQLWTSSKAELEDYPIVVQMLEALLIYTNELLSTSKFEAVLREVKEIEYAELKKYQLNQIRQSKQRSWKKSTQRFDDSILEQALNFVKDQRFIKLSKGSWVYVDNPTEPTKTPRYYFMILSTNNQSLIYKQFTKKLHKNPNIDRDGTKIEFSQIANIGYKPITKEHANSHFIDINSRLNVSKIEIFTKAKQSFSFYVDTKELLYVWLDGLKMLINNNSDLSEDTQFQMKWLTQIRKEIQLIDLSEFCEKSEEYKVDDGTLVELTTGFYYE